MGDRSNAAKRGKLPVNVKVILKEKKRLAAHTLKSLWQQIKTSWKRITRTAQMPFKVILNPRWHECKRAATLWNSPLTTANRDLHSASTEAIANAAQAMSQIVESLHTPDGKVAVKGFYDKVKTYDGRREGYGGQSALRRTKRITGKRRRCSPVKRLHFTGTGLRRPTLDVTGMWSGYTAEEGFRISCPPPLIAASCAGWYKPAIWRNYCAYQKNTLQPIRRAGHNHL